MKLSSSFFKRRYSEMRMGHSSVIAVLLQLGNFTLIGYALFVAEVLPDIEIWQFFGFFLAVYVPTAIWLGRWYRKHQQPIDREMRRGMDDDDDDDDKPKNALLLDFMEYVLQDRTDERAARLREQIRKQRGEKGS